MHGNEPALIENADHVRQLVHLDDAARAVGNRVVVAADRDQAIVADTSFEFEKCIERHRRQRLQFALLSHQNIDFQYISCLEAGFELGRGLRWPDCAAPAALCLQKSPSKFPVIPLSAAIDTDCWSTCALKR